MYSVASTRKCPLPIAGSSTLIASTALTLSASVLLPSTARASTGPTVCSTIYFTISSGV